VQPLRPIDESRLGAYGIRLHGVEAAGDLLVPVEPEAPAYTLATELGRAAPAPERVDEDGARLRLRSGGEIVVERDARRVLFRVPHPVRADELVHPYLAPAAAVIGRWAGRESVHAGAFAVGEHVWGVVGTREAGKSSTLAWLAREGVEILSDDMVILDGATPLTGPRSIDLRADAADRLGVGEAIGMTGARERWRVRLGPAPGGRPLSGWVFLAWGARVELRRLPASERIPRIAAERGLRLPPVRPEALLELAALPTWELSRPRGWDSLPASVERLMQLPVA
jgi:hypothetical protein